MANPILSNGVASPQSIYEQKKVTVIGGNQKRASGAHPVGTRGYLEDGRVFYYASNGATALTAGSLLTAPATLGLNRIGTHDKMILTASFDNFAAGMNPVLFDETDLDTDDIIENEYQDGYLSFQDVTGEGHYYKIKSHQGIDQALTRDREIHLYDPIKVSAGATTQISLARNRHDRVIASGTDEESAAVGVAPIAVSLSTALATDLATAEADTDTHFFWAQTWGPAVVQETGTAVLTGVAFGPGTTAKQVTATVTAGLLMPHIGWGLQSVGSAADFILVDLRICP